MTLSTVTSKRMAKNSTKISHVRYRITYVYLRSLVKYKRNKRNKCIEQMISLYV